MLFSSAEVLVHHGHSEDRALRLLLWPRGG